MIVSSLYFSGLMDKVNFICSFPGHDPTSTSAVRKGVDALLTTLGKCFKTDYLPDLINRHHASVKSQTATAAQKTFLNQLNTLHLNRYPRRYDRPPNKGALNLKTSTFLVVDDFCTNGRSLDVARAYIEAARRPRGSVQLVEDDQHALFAHEPSANRASVRGQCNSPRAGRAETPTTGQHHQRRCSCRNRLDARRV